MKTLDLFGETENEIRSVDAILKGSELYTETAHSGLPEGWAMTTLGTACEINPGKSPSGELMGTDLVSFVPMASVDAEAGAITEHKDRPLDEVKKGYTAFREGDVLFAKITPCMENGKAAIARSLTKGFGFGSTEFHVLRASEAVVPEYVFYFIRQERFRKEAGENMSGTAGQARVPAHFVQAFPFPLPPLAEQKRIVAQVEAALASVNAARERLAHVPAVLKKFRQSVLAAACSGRLTAEWREANPSVEPASELLARIQAERQEIEGKKYKQPATPDTRDLGELPETWAICKFGAVCKVQGGFAFKSTDYSMAGVPLVRISNLNYKTVVLGSSEVYLPLENKDKYEAFVLHKGDFLIAMSGATTGKTGIYDYDIPALLNQRVGRFIPNVAALTDGYLALCVRELQAVILEEAYGAAQPNISPQKIEDLTLCLPPVAEQAEVVRRVDALFALADAIEKRVHAATARTEKVTQAVLAKAFRGELVETEADAARREGRDYKTATALLQRIQGISRETESAPRPRPQRNAAPGTRSG